MSDSIGGAFMFQPADEEAQPEGESIGPLSFINAVALLMADYDATSYAARELLTDAAREGSKDLMSDTTRKGVRITYSA